MVNRIGTVHSGGLSKGFSSRFYAGSCSLSMGQIEVNSVLMLNWNVWNGSIFDILTVLLLNWIV